jgi:DNA-binding response OmpR family regulator
MRIVRLKPTTPLIFVAEDDPAILELVIGLLEQNGYRSRYATNGWLSWDGIRKSEPDGVLLDVNMGGMDGFAVLKAMRAHPPTAKTPVLMVTARGAPDDVAQAVALGARDYLTKPFKPAVLLQRVGRLVGRRGDSSPGPDARPPEGGEALVP